MKRLFFAALLCGLGASAGMACTNLIVTRGASADGSVMVTYAADSHQLYGELYYRPAADYPAGTMMQIRDWDTGKYLGEIPQVAHTYSVIGNMNEHQLVIGETTYGGREELLDTTGIIDYGSLIYITLQRAKTAREAISVIDDLLQKYGYASEGESFSIADPNEVWIMEMIGKSVKLDKKGNNVNRGAVWVAKRIPDGAISAHANQARITTIDFNDPENCLYSKDVVKFAREYGIFQGKDSEFSFCDVYAPLDFSGARACEARVWSYFNRFSKGMDKYLDYAMGYDLENHMPLYVTPDHKISNKELADMMRDHYEGTPMDMTTDIGAGGSHLPYRWRPMSFEYQGHKYINERAIATQQTGWWFVAQCRADKPFGIYWFGVDDAGTSPLTPYFSLSSEVAPYYAEGNGSLIEYSETSMYWTVSRIAQFCYLRYDKIGAEVRSVIDEWENGLMSGGFWGIDDLASSLSREKLSQLLTTVSVSTSTELFNKWKELDKTLLVKYIDGNIKKQNADGSFMNNGYDERVPASPIQEPYSEKWIENVVRDNGKVLQVPE